ncbi:MAG: DUF2490 domain-containing protein [Acidobacteriota bacterium]
MTDCAFICPRRALACLWLAGVLAACPGWAMAGEPPDQDIQVWTPTVCQVGLSERWTVHIETQVKVVQDVHEVQNSLLRSAVMVKVGKSATLYVGYAWIPYFYPVRTNEHRTWQQVVWTARAGKWTLAPRVRFEQRFLPAVGRASFRLRGQLKAMLPLSADGSWQLSVSDEVFLHLNTSDPARRSGFAGNRAQLGVTRRVSRQISIEPAYLLQHVERPDRLRDEIDHVIMLTTVVRF